MPSAQVAESECFPARKKRYRFTGGRKQQTCIPPPSLPRGISINSLCHLRKELPRIGTRNCHGMSRQNRDLSQYALRLMENAQLSQYRASVVVDFFPCQTVIVVERVYPQSGNSTRRLVAGRPRQPPRCVPRIITSTRMASSVTRRRCTLISKSGSAFINCS